MASLEDEESKTYTIESKKHIIVSSDNTEYDIDSDLLIQSETLKKIINLDRDAEKIPLRVSGEILVMIIEYMTYHKGNVAKKIIKPIKSSNMAEIVDAFDATFINKANDRLTILNNLTMAAEYLEINPLLDLCLAKIASNIMGKTADEIRAYFSQDGKPVEDDLTPEQKLAYSRANIFM
jgi:S-phase kinase-associated protein 1